MTDQQFEQIMYVLKNIELHTSSIESNLSSIHTNTHTMNDLDSIHEQLAKLIKLMSN